MEGEYEEEEQEEGGEEEEGHEEKGDDEENWDEEVQEGGRRRKLISEFSLMNTKEPTNRIRMSWFHRGPRRGAVCDWSENER